MLIIFHIIRRAGTSHHITVEGGLRRGGLTLAVAPRVPVFTEDVGKSRR